MTYMTTATPATSMTCDGGNDMFACWTATMTMTSSWFKRRVIRYG
jgi:hypothetical protein